MAKMFLHAYSKLNSKRRWTVFCKNTQKRNTLYPNNSGCYNLTKHMPLKRMLKKYYQCITYGKHICMQN